MNKIIYPDIYGKGMLFAFSGLDGNTDYQRDFVCTLTEQPIGLRIETKNSYYFYIDIKDKIQFTAVTGDVIEAVCEAGKIFISFLNCYTIIGYSPVFPELYKGEALNENYNIKLPDYIPELKCTKKDGIFYFTVTLSEKAGEITEKLMYNTNYGQLRQRRLNYLGNLPKCHSDRNDIMKLYYKAFAVNKLNIHSAQGNFKYRWTTPDRLPHRDMWLWDSAFHALTVSDLDIKVAEESLITLFSQQLQNGMIPIRMTPFSAQKEMTQPPVLAWSVWQLYCKSKNIPFLADTLSFLEAYIKWDIENRDSNNNGLLEWRIEEHELCRSGESGLDNSPRFDDAMIMDAIDFSCFMANEMYFMYKIMLELGYKEKSIEWYNKFKNLSNIINQNLWCEQDKIYFDKKLDGSFSKVAAVTSFLPLFAGVCNKHQAEYLAGHLADSSRFFTSMPIPSVSADNSDYSTDMWRGATWLNMNYFVIVGLIRYGYTDLAEKIREKTVSEINKWYQKTGCIFEFYDSQGLIEPYYLHRKGAPLRPFDWRKQIHSICDFNWSAVFTIKLIQKDIGYYD